MEQSPYTLTGALGEDKPGLMETAESQVVASMVLLATYLGSLAIKQNKKAIIFGQVRAVVSKWEGAVYIYKLDMNFEKGQTIVSKGNTPVDTSKFIQSVKKLLENPEESVC